MDKEMDFMKIGLYALAGFGAFAVYNKYMGGDKAADVIVVGGGEDATTSFSGTDWQNAGRSRETMWQGSGLYTNASGRTMGASKTGRALFNTWTPGDHRGEVRRTPSGVYASASGYSNARGTDWQRSGQVLSSGTDWQEIACSGTKQPQ